MAAPSTRQGGRHSLLEQAEESGQRGSVGGIRRKRAGMLASVAAIAIPVGHPRTSDPLLLVAFARESGAATAPTTATGAEELSDQADLSAAEALGPELRATRVELSTANEEILSVTEKLQSSGEEMGI